VYLDTFKSQGMAHSVSVEFQLAATPERGVLFLSCSSQSQPNIFSSVLQQLRDLSDVK